MNTITSRKILVVDDDPNIIKAYQRILQKISAPESSGSGAALRSLLSVKEEKSETEAWELVTAEQGMEAVERVQDAVDRGEPFAMALVDVRMPPGIDGIEAARRMREIDPSLYLAIVTAYADRSIEEMQEILQGDFMLLRKPFDADEIRQIVSYFALSWSKQQ